MGLTKAERDVRDGRVMTMLIAGKTYREIAAAVGLATESAAHKIVTRQLRASASRRDLISDAALDLHLERIEKLFSAHFDRAIDGDHKSAELCRRLLGQEARILGMTVTDGPLRSGIAPEVPADTEETEQPSEQADDSTEGEGPLEPTNELERFRSRRHA
ncbi:hypothetical protein QSJ19_01045 [Gordonia sp. ABSL11-1]|uniref:hypothetical protein n=1 Tax=Gordonia sp. ABSL11-1 TaxID=3053924 RepID=UPI0025729059|nr:hypothetical protein [Gordonia sp. ABSL11-1]MDL9944188.1 hypothetical protein [Gordonia sp. ABSL11-1]